MADTPGVLHNAGVAERGRAKLLLLMVYADDFDMGPRRVKNPAASVALLPARFIVALVVAGLHLDHVAGPKLLDGHRGVQSNIGLFLCASLGSFVRNTAAGF